MIGDGRMRCQWHSCVNNMHGECFALNQKAKTKDGREHILDTLNCPFYKVKPEKKEKK